MQDKTPENEQGEPHGVWDIPNVKIIDGKAKGYFIYYTYIDNNIVEKKEYYAR